MLLLSNSAYSRSLSSHSLMLTERGCDSICVGCKTGMIVELGICVSNDAIIGDYTSSSSYLKMTQHIIAARLTQVTLSTERMGHMGDEIMTECFIKQMCHCKLSSHMPELSQATTQPIFLIIQTKGSHALQQTAVVYMKLCCNRFKAFWAI